MFQRRNLTLLTAVLPLIMILITGCAPKMLPEAPWEKDARALLEQADAARGAVGKRCARAP